MKDIEIGEYVRTKNKGIKRIDRIDNNKTVNKYLYFTGIEDFEGKEYGIIKTTEIVKHSKQLIDLIEIKDLICFKNTLSSNTLENEEMIIHIFNNETLQEVKQAIEDEEIKIISILTKESYMANCYKVGGKDETNND